MPESITLTTDESVSIWVSSEEIDIQQPFLGEALATQASVAASPVLEDNGNYHLETPSSVLENDDVSQPSLEEMLGLDCEDNDALGLSFKDTGGVFIAAIDPSQLLDEPFEAFFCCEDRDALQSFEELDALPKKRDSFQPDPEEAPNSSPHATTVPSPTDLPDSTEKVTTMPPVEPVSSKPSPGAASAASDLGQEGDYILILLSEFATDSKYYDRVHKNDTGEDRTSGSLACSQSFEAQQSKIESGDGSGDDDVHSRERSSLAEKDSPASPRILETQRSKMDFGNGGNEVIFIRSRKRKRPSSAEQNSPACPEILESNEVIFVRSRKR